MLAQTYTHTQALLSPLIWEHNGTHGYTGNSVLVLFAIGVLISLLPLSKAEPYAWTLLAERVRQKIVGLCERVCTWVRVYMWVRGGMERPGRGWDVGCYKSSVCMWLLGSQFVCVCVFCVFRGGWRGQWVCDLWQWQDTISHLGELFIIICSVTQLECIHLGALHTCMHTLTLLCTHKDTHMHARANVFF